MIDNVKDNKFSALILAAGKGTRMKSDLAKVLHILNGKPLLYYSVAAAKEAGAEKIVAVVGYQYGGITFIIENADQKSIKEVVVIAPFIRDMNK